MGKAGFVPSRCPGMDYSLRGRLIDNHYRRSEGSHSRLPVPRLYGLTDLFHAGSELGLRCPVPQGPLLGLAEALFCRSNDCHPSLPSRCETSVFIGEYDLHVKRF